MTKNTNYLLILLLIGVVLAIFVTSATALESDSIGESKKSLIRLKRGYGGGGGGGGGGHGGGSYGHGPGAGGGARGPVYFCGWVGSKMGSGGYGGYGK